MLIFQARSKFVTANARINNKPISKYCGLVTAIMPKNPYNYK